MTAPNPSRQRAAKRKVADLFAHPARVCVIHYACESFDKAGSARAPRITAVVVRNLESGRTTTFSLHLEAEPEDLGPVAVLPRLDRLERTMLDKLFAFLSADRKLRLVHWRMRNATYGFAHIERRYAALGGAPHIVPDAQCLDLEMILQDIYGPAYARSDRFATLARLNGLSTQGLLSGADEAAAFRQRAYLDIQRSTTAKVDLFFEVLRRVHDGALKTESGWWTLHAGQLREAAELFRTSPMTAWGSTLAAALTVGFTVWRFFAG